MAPSRTASPRRGPATFRPGRASAQSLLVAIGIVLLVPAREVLAARLDLTASCRIDTPDVGRVLLSSPLLPEGSCPGNGSPQAGRMVARSEIAYGDGRRFSYEYRLTVTFAVPVLVRWIEFLDYARSGGVTCWDGACERPPIDTSLGSWSLDGGPAVPVVAAGSLSSTSYTHDRASSESGRTYTQHFLQAGFGIDGFPDLEKRAGYRFDQEVARRGSVLEFAPAAFSVEGPTWDGSLSQQRWLGVLGLEYEPACDPVAPVPEPATILLVSPALAALATVRWLRRRRDR